MLKYTLISAAISAIFIMNSSALAQDPPFPLKQGNTQPGQAPYPNFPTPEQLANMAPAEPMTEEKIKARFTQRKAHMTAALERDRKSAEQYARNFARMQKHQADKLADIMANAEKRREKILKSINEQQQRVLENFRNRNTSIGPKPKLEPAQY